MIRTHDEIHADRAPLAIVPLIETAPETAPASTLSDQGAEIHTRIRVDHASGSTGLSGGNHLPHCDGFFGGRCEPDCPRSDA